MHAASATPVTDAGRGRPVVGRVDVDAHRDPVRPGVQRRRRSSPASRRAPPTRRRAAGRTAGCCPRPASWRRTRSASASSDLDAHPLDERARGCIAPGTVGQAAASAGRPDGHDRRRSSEACRRAALGVRTVTARPPPTRPTTRRPAAAARRPLAGLPRVLRAAGGELLDHHRAADQRRLRLHLDAHQRPARRAADPRRGRVRRVAPDLPHRDCTPTTRPTARQPRRLPGPGRRWSTRCSTRCAIPSSRPRATRPTTSSPRSPPRPSARASTSLICTGDRDALPAGQRPGHRALPAQGRLRPVPVDARGGRRRSTA